jgi:hypothetical protein
MGRSKKKTQSREVKAESLYKWIVDPKSPIYLKRKLLEALEEGSATS